MNRVVVVFEAEGQGAGIAGEPEFEFSSSEPLAQLAVSMRGSRIERIGDDDGSRIRRFEQWIAHWLRAVGKAGNDEIGAKVRVT